MSDFHQARKRFGQNFLQDDLIVDRICASVRPSAGQSLIEIGPGQGVLTQRLVHTTPEMTIIELDRDLIPNLHAYCLARSTSSKQMF